jgi:aminoglycoside/choline kinase family phosphotransferase
MPRMPGACLDDRTIGNTLTAEDRREVAVALGANLALMQEIVWPFAGDFDPSSIALTPYRGGSTQSAIDETARMFAMCESRASVTREDRQWFEDVAARALAVNGVRPNTYVHCDYKLNNLTLSKAEDGWRVSGLFDFHEARFADGALDIVRQACGWLDSEPPLAKVFVDSYRAHAPADPSIAERMALYLINDRMKFWEFFARPESPAAWTQGKTFRQWAQPYLDRILALL